MLEGAKYILMERFAEDASLLDKLRTFLKDNATLSARLVAGKETEGAKFSDYFEHDEPLKSVPSHRALAIFRGRNEGVLTSTLKVGEELPGTLHPCEGMIGERFGIRDQGRAADKWLGEVVRWTWKVKLGNGTASRETDKLAAELIKKYPGLNMTKIMVSEAGASVYSASELAAKEFPELDVSLRGAVSIARRLQDPLAELVKIEPKAIGVGQYQHDVSQLKLARSLDAVVEDCVNAVGVDVNTASAALLARISGLNSTLAQNIVQFRDANGAFKSRSELKKVPRLGDKTFELAAGFLRVMNGDNPLDASAVHPETYPLVQRIAEGTSRDIRSLIGDSGFLKRLDPKQFTDEHFGLPTVTDILKELDKPGRDPRPEFKTAAFQDGVETIKDLKPGMILEGVVTNVANFGAFVDIGVHQDGLVHISALSEKFIKDPREAVKAGDVVKVKVMEVDIARQRIGLSMRMGDTPGAKAEGPRGGGNRGNAPRSERHSPQDKPAPSNNAMAALFANAKQLRKN
ncbi:Polyribonucleotide nucleotidyltransferase [compost metagenome]